MLVNNWTEIFSDQWFDFCCIWIKDSLITGYATSDLTQANELVARYFEHNSFLIEPCIYHSKPKLSQRIPQPYLLFPLIILDFFALERFLIDRKKRKKKKKKRPLQPPPHGCVAAAYLGSVSANHLSDSERR